MEQEKQFHFQDGSAVGDLEELQAKIEALSYDEFYHHVNAEKNDFASWVRHVLQFESVADELDKVTSIVETVEIINDHLNPQPVEAPHEDIQSKIEESLDIHPTEEPVQEHTPQEAAPAAEEPAQHHDHVRMIVKDFMYGLVFGLVIGIVLGRLLTF
ncbi:MAG: hypothetical protein OXR66_07850 [Candidatus Woesearchaeota archaeon]|nr:hypothetical protein [Candidatus Woesearchaeota archaeon]